MRKSIEPFAGNAFLRYDGNGSSSSGALPARLYEAGAPPPGNVTERESSPCGPLATSSHRVIWTVQVSAIRYG